MPFWAWISIHYIDHKDQGQLQPASISGNWLKKTLPGLPTINRCSYVGSLPNRISFLCLIHCRHQARLTVGMQWQFECIGKSCIPGTTEVVLLSLTEQGIKQSWTKIWHAAVSLIPKDIWGTDASQLQSQEMIYCWDEGYSLRKRAAKTGNSAQGRRWSFKYGTGGCYMTETCKDLCGRWR